MKNPPWTRDELILALDTYFKIIPRAPDPSQTEIRELSSLLRSMGNFESDRADNYRTPASAVMKLMNFRSIDPDYPGAGLSAAARGDKEVWDEFAGDQDRLKKVANAIRNAEHLERNLKPYEYSDITEAPEGGTLTRLHVTRERNRKLVESRKRKTLKEKGSLTCEVCNFNFEKAYGKRGEGFIECHHTKPLHTLESGSKTNVEDLALVCANCHRMIHSQRPWLSIEGLKSLLIS